MAQAGRLPIPPPPHLPLHRRGQGRLSRRGTRPSEARLAPAAAPRQPDDVRAQEEGHGEEAARHAPGEGGRAGRKRQAAAAIARAAAAGAGLLESLARGEQVGVELDGTLERLGRLLEAPLPKIDAPQVEVGRGIAAVEGDGPLDRLDGLLDPLLAVEGEAQVRNGSRRVWLGGQCLAERGLGGPVVPRDELEQPPQVERRGVLWLELEDPTDPPPGAMSGSAVGTVGVMVKWVGRDSPSASRATMRTARSLIST